MTPYQFLIQEAHRNDTEKNWDAVVSEFHKRIQTAKLIDAYRTDFDKVYRDLSREAAIAIALAVLNSDTDNN